MLGIFRHNTSEANYAVYLKTLAENEKRLQENDKQDPETKNQLRLKYNDICNHIIPFVATDNINRAAANACIDVKNGRKIHPLTTYLNLELFRQSDDIEEPFVSSIYATQQHTDRWPCSFMSYVISIEHHIADFTGKAAPIGWWTECIQICIDPADEALLTAGYVLGQDSWDKLATDETAVKYLTEVAEKKHQIFPAGYKTKQTLLSQTITPKGHDTVALNNHIDMHVFRLPYDIEDPHITDITIEKEQIRVTIQHKFGATDNYQYEETFIL